VGLAYAVITLKNPRRPDVAPVALRALADTGANHLCIPRHVADRLCLEKLYAREVMTADGSKRMCDYDGPIELGFESRACFVGALVLGDETLLGAVPMEDMDLIVSPASRTVTTNPNSPDVPQAIVKPVAA
jgi:clan AA aspartic protease